MPHLVMGGRILVFDYCLQDGSYPTSIRTGWLQTKTLFIHISNHVVINDLIKSG